jgi:hypothetical protein
MIQSERDWHGDDRPRSWKRRRRRRNGSARGQRPRSHNDPVPQRSRFKSQSSAIGLLRIFVLPGGASACAGRYAQRTRPAAYRSKHRLRSAGGHDIRPCDGSGSKQEEELNLFGVGPNSGLWTAARGCQHSRWPCRRARLILLRGSAEAAPCAGYDYLVGVTFATKPSYGLKASLAKLA